MAIKRPLLTIIKDTREQMGYDFSQLKPQPVVIDKCLETGDYSINGMESIVTIERKSMSDAFQTFGKGRKRFERELSRMMQFTFAAVVIEADWMTILTDPPKYSRMRPATIYSSVIAWQQRYGVHFWLCPNRAFAERTTYRILERFYRDWETKISSSKSVSSISKNKNSRVGRKKKINERVRKKTPGR